MEQWGSKQVPLPGETRGPPAPEVRSGGSAGNGAGWYHLLALPDDFPDVTVLDETGTPLTSARTGDGRYMLIFDGSVGESVGQSSMPVAREFIAVSADGSQVAKLAVMSLPRASAPVDIRQVRDCLRREGLNIVEPPMPAGANEPLRPSSGSASGRRPPLPPEAARRGPTAAAQRSPWVGLPAEEMQKMTLRPTA
jgi:hypothetical protein